MADKRRRARVQGGWASSSSSKDSQRVAPTNHKKVDQKSSLAYNFNPTVEVTAQYHCFFFCPAAAAFLYLYRCISIVIVLFLYYSVDQKKASRHCYSVR